MYKKNLKQLYILGNHIIVGSVSIAILTLL